MGSYDSLHALFWSFGGMSIPVFYILVIEIFGGNPTDYWPAPPLGIILVYAAVIGGGGLGWLIYRLTHDGGGWGSGPPSDNPPSGYDNDGSPLY